MMHWMTEEQGRLLVDVVQSMSVKTEEILHDHTALAVYSDVKPTMTDLNTIYDANKSLRDAAEKIEGHPGEYLRAMLLSNDCYLRILQGDKIDYRTRVREIQELELAEVPQQNFDILSERIGKKLTDRGYHGTVPEMIRAYLTDTRIEPEMVTTVTRQYLDRLKDATLKKVAALPEDDGIISIKGVRGVFWSGYSAYPGDHKGTLEFNIDRPWSIPTFVNVLSHEGYPGHQTFYCRWDWNYQRGLMPIEGAYYLINSPTNAMFEGSPENGLNFLGWTREDVETPEITKEEKDTFMLGRDILDIQRIVQNNANFYFNAEGESRENVSKYITSTGIMNAVEAENTIRFFSDPVQCTYYPAYYYGTYLIRKCFDCFDADKKQDFYSLIYDKPQTTKTLIKDVEAVTGKKVNLYEGI